MNNPYSIGNIPVRKEFLGFGESAIFNTITKIKDEINKGRINLYVRHWAEKIVAPVKPNDRIGEVQAIFDFVKSNLRYTRDPYGMEFVQTPDLLLRQIEAGETPAADCDDYTTLAGALLKSIGYPVALKATSYKPDKNLRHIYLLVNAYGKWIPFDAIRREKNLGWEAPGITRAVEVRA